MRQGNQNNRNNRSRNRGGRTNTGNGGGGGGNPANKVYDSNGPEVRVRGSAQTVADKYLQLAGDAQSQGDRIMTESYFQYAEHYLRIVAANQALVSQKQAEKDKVAEEQAARNKEKQDKAAAELAKKSGKPEATAQKVEDHPTAADSNSDKKVNDDDWGGHQPAFLQREDNKSEDSTAEDNPEAEKPKKPRRKTAKNKKSADNDAPAAPSTDTEAEAETGATESA